MIPAVLHLRSCMSNVQECEHNRSWKKMINLIRDDEAFIKDKVTSIVHSI